MPAIQSQEMDLPKQVHDKPVVFNKEARSYFRVRYDGKSLCKLAKLLREEHTRMSAVERAQLLDDLAPLAMPNPNCKPCGIAGWVHMQDYLKKERDYIPWKTALYHLERLKGMLEGTLAETKFGKWMESLIQPYFDDRGYGMDNEKTEGEKLLKQHMVRYACLRSDADISSPCVKEAFTQVNGWMSADLSRNPISPYLRSTFYKTVMNFSSIEKDPEIVIFFLRKYEDAKKLRFRHLEHFQQLHNTYMQYSLTKLSKNNTRSEHEETTGMDDNMDALCSSVATTKMSVDTTDLGINVLKRCWYKLQPIKEAAQKVKELVSNVVSRRQIEELERWGWEENEREDVREAVKMLTAEAKEQLKCADMVANTLAQVLPE